MFSPLQDLLRLTGTGDQRLPGATGGVDEAVGFAQLTVDGRDERSTHGRGCGFIYSFAPRFRSGLVVENARDEPWTRGLWWN